MIDNFTDDLKKVVLPAFKNKNLTGCEVIVKNNRLTLRGEKKFVAKTLGSIKRYIKVYDKVVRLK